MTLIECFDRTVLENIAGTLYLRPDQLVIVGNEGRISAFLPQLTALLQKRNMTTRIRICDTTGLRIRQIAKALADIVSHEEECIIDLTGGDEPAIMAVGAMLARLDDKKHVSIQKFDLLSPSATDCDQDGQATNGRSTFLTVEELVALHGGTAQAVREPSFSHCTPKDIQKLWDIVSGDPRNWNNGISVLTEFEKRSDSADSIVISRARLQSELRDFRRKESEFLALLEQFIRGGIVEDQSNGDTIQYRYTSELYRYCTKKAGNVLELKTLLEARAAAESEESYFDDCAMSVTIDWDGKIQSKYAGLPDTRNEIDLVLTKGLRPLFISCKNGFVDESELYKLNTVAHHFGGPRARKMLIATDLDQKSPSATRAWIQRARDMDIQLVTDAAQLTSEQWQDALRWAMR